AEPVQVTGINDAVGIAVSRSRASCAIHGDGGVSCWGSNGSGILGTGATDSLAHSVPARVPGVIGAVEVAMGESHACARRSAGTVTCWGRNQYGQLGSGTLGTTVQAPADVPSITTAV